MIKDTSESVTERGQRLVDLALVFDGTPVQVFSFVQLFVLPTDLFTGGGLRKGKAAQMNETQIKNQSNQPKVVSLEYVTYDRFNGTVDRKADRILQHMKDREVLVVSYTLDGANKTDMYVLEGLAEILRRWGK